MYAAALKLSGRLKFPVSLHVLAALKRLSVCWSRLRALQKRMNRSRCRPKNRALSGALMLQQEDALRSDCNRHPLWTLDAPVGRNQ